MPELAPAKAILPDGRQAGVFFILLPEILHSETTFQKCKK